MMQNLDPSLVRSKIQKYCSYQERCHKEIRNKLYEMGVAGHELELIIMELIESDFVNEERFAKAYAGGKFRVKKWGKNRIIQELERRQISEYCIKSALNEISDTDYQKTIRYLIEKKLDRSAEKNQYVKNGKVASYCIGKGYESQLVWDLIREISPIK